MDACEECGTSIQSHVLGGRDAKFPSGCQFCKHTSRVRAQRLRRMDVDVIHNVYKQGEHVENESMDCTQRREAHLFGRSHAAESIYVRHAFTPAVWLYVVQRRVHHSVSNGRIVCSMLLQTLWTCHDGCNVEWRQRLRDAKVALHERYFLHCQHTRTRRETACLGSAQTKRRTGT